MKSLILSVLLLLSVFTSAQKVGTRQKSSCSFDADAPTVSFCDLVNNQAFYNNKIVRLKARYTVGFEVAAFEDDPQCYAPPGRMMNVEFDESYKVNTDKTVLKTFSDALRVRGNRWGELRKMDVSVIGQFHGAKEGIKLGDVVTRPGYGHLGGHRYQFTVRCIEQAQRVIEKSR